MPGFGRFRRRPAALGAAAPRQVGALEYYGALRLQDPTGWWVYALEDARDLDLTRPYPERVFYVGQSESLFRRLDDWRRVFPERFSWAGIWLIKVRDSYQADLRELELIDHYQPECNHMGRAAELRDRINRYQGKQRRTGRSAAPLDASKVTP
jgi:hypothetical protein